MVDVKFEEGRGPIAFYMLVGEMNGEKVAGIPEEVCKHMLSQLDPSSEHDQGVAALLLFALNAIKRSRGEAVEEDLGNDFAQGASETRH